MSRRTLAVSGILLVFLTEVVLLSILVNLNMQRTLDPNDPSSYRPFPT